MKIVIALGGNALVDKKSKGSAEEQTRKAKRAMERLKRIIKRNKVVITHGNGPQVGELLIQQEKAGLTKMPLDVLVAMTQGEIGYFIQQALNKIGIKKTATVITRVLISDKEKKRMKATKPIGPFFENKIPGIEMIEDSGRGWRRVVPSPKISKVIEKEAIKELMDRGFVVICGGGGGIPTDKKGNGIEAVVDKDNLSSVLAKEIGADAIIFITAVPQVYVNFGKKNQKGIRKMSKEEAKKLLKKGEFGEGSMKPKIEGAIEFLKKGKKAIICSIENVDKAIQGKAGTTIYA